MQTELGYDDMQNAEVAEFYGTVDDSMDGVRPVEREENSVHQESAVEAAKEATETENNGELFSYLKICH